jgi:hypothetical protein
VWPRAAGQPADFCSMTPRQWLVQIGRRSDLLHVVLLNSEKNTTHAEASVSKEKSTNEEERMIRALAVIHFGTRVNHASGGGWGLVEFVCRPMSEQRHSGATAGTNICALAPHPVQAPPVHAHTHALVGYKLRDQPNRSTGLSKTARKINENDNNP